MIGSLRALLEAAIDYAGLFPPARLPLAAAVESFSRYRRTGQAWMLGHFVLPIGQLDEFGAPVDRLDEQGTPVTVAVVAPAEPDRDTWLATTQRNVAAISRFNAQHSGRAAVRAMEMRLPNEMSETIDSKVLETLLGRFAALIPHSDVDHLARFIEASLAGDWRTNVATLIDALAATRQRLGLPIGLKLRTGGLEPAAFPTPQQVAAVIWLCREARLPWKATAGLHHALRQYRDEVGAEMHGFLNLLVAAVLAHAQTLGEAEIAEILRDGSPRSFVCEETQISWHNRRATLHQIRQARQDGILSFGSCSFDEPREELEKLAIVAPCEKS